MILLDGILERSWGRVWRYFAGGEGSKLNICDHKGSMLVSQDVKCLFCFGWILVLKFFTKFNAVRVIRFAWSSEIWAEVIAALISRTWRANIWFVMPLFLYFGYENKFIGLGLRITAMNIILFLTNSVDIEQTRTSFMVADHLLLGYLSQ